MSVAVCEGDETFYTHTSTLLRDDDRSPEEDAVAKKVRHFAHLRDDGKKTSIILMTSLFKIRFSARNWKLENNNYWEEYF